VNKTELTEALAEATDFTKADAQRAIDALFDTEEGVISGTLKGGEKVQITGFGTFETRERKARMGRNPQTGEKIRIPASTAVSFRAGKGLKDSVN
jgi:DNA-binding protein HU-beta